MIFGEPPLRIVISVEQEFQIVYSWLAIQQLQFCWYNYQLSTTIVNTSLAECKNISLAERTTIYKNYPKCILSEELKAALEFLKSNKNLRTYKLLHVSDKKYNELNLFLLQQHFTTKALPLLLMELANHSTKKITTYKKLERQLKSFEIGGII